MLTYKNQDSWQVVAGNQQSPIELSANHATIMKEQRLPLEFIEPYSLVNERNDQTTIQLQGTGSAKIFNRQFQLVLVHFHAPAEHVIDNRIAPFEIHLVHQNSIGQLVVIALLAQIGQPDCTVQEIINHYQEDVRQAVNIPINSWLNHLAATYHYLGSLTTPPLTEGVEWLVISQPQVTVSNQQIQWFINHFEQNNRHPQPLNDRNVDLYK